MYCGCAAERGPRATRLRVGCAPERGPRATRLRVGCAPERGPRATRLRVGCAPERSWVFLRFEVWVRVWGLGGVVSLAAVIDVLVAPCSCGLRVSGAPAHPQVCGRPLSVPSPPPLHHGCCARPPADREFFCSRLLIRQRFLSIQLLNAPFGCRAAHTPTDPHPHFARPLNITLWAAFTPTRRHTPRPHPRPSAAKKGGRRPRGGVGRAAPYPAPPALARAQLVRLSTSDTLSLPNGTHTTNCAPSPELWSRTQIL